MVSVYQMEAGLGTEEDRAGNGNRSRRSWEQVHPGLRRNPGGTQK